MNQAATPAIRTCPCCGLVQSLPQLRPKTRICCSRCGSNLQRRSAILRSNSRTAAIATAALILYPFAVSMPMLEIEQFGHVNDASILTGISQLFSAGQIFIGIIVLLCSVIFPVTKLLGLLILCSGLGRRHARPRAMTYQLVEWTGRWGMLDVLLVALLVAVVKLGDTVNVTAGPAALAFGCVVVLSLIATASFDPHSLWEAEQ